MNGTKKWATAALLLLSAALGDLNAQPSMDRNQRPTERYGSIDAFIPWSAYTYPATYASPFISLQPRIFMTSLNYPGVYGSTYLRPGGGMSPIVSMTGEVVGTREAGKPAHIVLRVDADAEIWLDGVKVNGDGDVRRISTGLLEPGNVFEGEIQARWTERGVDKVKSARLRLRAGNQIFIDWLPEKVEDKVIERSLRGQ